MPGPLYLARCAWAESRGAVGFDAEGRCLACAKIVHTVEGRADFDALGGEEGGICVRVRKRDRSGASGWIRAAALGVALPLAIGGCGTSETTDTGSLPAASPTISDTVEQTDSAEEPWIGILIEEMPQLVGGIEAFREHVRYPEGADSLEIEGRVFVSFTVSETGAVETIEVMRGLHPMLDAEAVRLVREHAQFTPGRQRGEPVAMRMAIPVVFHR